MGHNHAAELASQAGELQTPTELGQEFLLLRKNNGWLTRQSVFWSEAVLFE